MSELRHRSTYARELYVTITIERRGSITGSPTAAREQNPQYLPGALGPRIRCKKAIGRFTESLSFPRVEKQRRQRVFNEYRIGTLHVHGCGTADLARDGRIEQQHREARRHRLERREAKAFVLGEKGEGARAGVQRVKLLVCDVRAQLDAIVKACRASRAGKVDVRRSPVLADDLEPRVRVRTRETRESLDQLRDVTTIEDGAYKENGLTLGSEGRAYMARPILVISRTSRKGSSGARWRKIS